MFQFQSPGRRSLSASKTLHMTGDNEQTFRSAFGYRGLISLPGTLWTGCQSPRGRI